jgi:hypothetical protein
VPITRLTLYQIAGNAEEIVITHAGPDQHGKYAGWITFGEDRNCRPLLSTAPHFETPEAAIAAMKEIVDCAKTFTEKDLEDPNNPVAKYLSPNSAGSA